MAKLVEYRGPITVLSGGIVSTAYYGDYGLSTCLLTTYFNFGEPTAFQVYFRRSAGTYETTGTAFTVTVSSTKTAGTAWMSNNITFTVTGYGNSGGGGQAIEACKAKVTAATLYKYTSSCYLDVSMTFEYLAGSPVTNPTQVHKIRVPLSTTVTMAYTNSTSSSATFYQMERGYLANYNITTVIGGY